MAEERRQRSVVTGASGFIGSHLVDALLERGDEVIGLDVKPAHREHERYQFVEADISRTFGILDRTDCWYHLAALTSPWQSIARPQEYELVNVRGTDKVLNAAAVGGTRAFVFVSTSALYGEVACPRRAAENDALPADLTPYAATKARGEAAVAGRTRADGWAGACLRLGNIYGPRQDPATEAGVVAIFATALLRAKPSVRIYGDGGIRDFVHVADCVDAILRAGALDRWIGTINVGAGEGTSVWQILRLLEESSGKRANVRRQPHRQGETGRTVLDPYRAESELDWRATTPLAEGLAATLAWFKAKKGGK